MNVWKLSGAGVVVFALMVATSARSMASAAPVPLESPDEEECYEWKYPKSDACGTLSGSTECKSQPTIEGSDDDEKKEKCKPQKGDVCFCE